MQAEEDQLRRRLRGTVPSSGRRRIEPGSKAEGTGRTRQRCAIRAETAAQSTCSASRVRSSCHAALRHSRGLIQPHRAGAVGASRVATACSMASAPTKAEIVQRIVAVPVARMSTLGYVTARSPCLRLRYVPKLYRWCLHARSFAAQCGFNCCFMWVDACVEEQDTACTLVACCGKRGAGPEAPASPKPAQEMER